MKFRSQLTQVSIEHPSELEYLERLTRQSDESLVFEGSAWEVVAMPLFYLVMIAASLGGKALSESWTLSPRSGLLSFAMLMIAVAATSRLTMAFAAALLDLGRSQQGLRLARSSRIALQYLWILIVPAVLATSGWNDWLIAIPGVADWTTLQVLGWLAPAWLSLILIDLAWFEWESQALRFANQYASSPHASNSASDSHTWYTACWNHARHGWLMVSLAALIVCGAVDLLQPWIQNVRSPWIQACVYLFATLLALIILPEWVFWMWKTHAISPDSPHLSLASLWQQLCGSRSILRTWETQQTQCNAMVVGVLPWRRRLLLSDGLLKKLSLTELQMVVCHEAAHVRRFHAWLRMLPLAFSLLLVLGGKWLRGNPSLYLPLSFDQHAMMWFLLVAKVGVSLWLFYRVAHWTELDADRYAIQLATQQNIFPASDEGRALAAQAMAQALLRVTPPHLHHKRTWLHPSIEQRTIALTGVSS